MTRRERVAAGAAALVGVRFRLHGRAAASGLDCIGVAAAALGAAGIGVDAPRGYRLRGGDAARVGAFVEKLGLAAVEGPRAGDVLLFRVSARQLHVAVASGDGFVHADAGLGRVVERPWPAPWPLIGCWRVRD